MQDRLRHAVAHAKQLENARLSNVYFIECEGFIKIGYAKDLARKVSNTQVGNPFKVKLLASFKTTRPHDDEATLHRMFKFYRVRGEWFRLPNNFISWLAESDPKAINMETIEAQRLLN